MALGTASRARQAYSAAFGQLTGRPLSEPWRFNGRTELAAATDVLRAHAVEPSPPTLDAFISLIVDELQARAADMRRDGRVLPGAREALLECAVELPPHAWRRAAKHLGQRFSGADTVLIGDTVLDVATGRAAEARVVAVATGPATAAELLTAGADVVLDDLTDTGAVLDAIMAARS